MFKKIAVDSFQAYVFFAFIAMTGLSYINFLPGVVSALAGGIGLSGAEAGQVVALNGYGGLLGSAIAVFLVRKIHWQPVIFICLLALMVADIGTIWLADYVAMLKWRFFAGVLGGLCVGIAFSALARLNKPDRAFGLLLFIQFSIGALVIYVLPGLEKQLSAYAVFYVMASFALFSLIFLKFLPALPLNRQAIRQSLSFTQFLGKPLLLLVAIMLYQVAASAIWAYVGLIGQSANMTAENVSLYIAATGLLGLLGAMLPVIGGKDYGRFRWIVAGVALSIVAALLLRFSEHVILYVIAMALLFFSWPVVQSYLLAVTADIDGSGQLSAVAAIVSSVGLASGPLLASGLLDNGDFSLMLYACAAIFLMSFFLLFKPAQIQEKNETAVLAPQYQV